MAHQVDMFSRAADAILADAIDRFRPTKIFALYSGGHDSLCSTHLAMRHCEIEAVVHINTTIGVPETRVHVRETCKKLGWPLLELFPPQTYEDLVRQFGFPGPGFHILPYTLLKERCIDELKRRYKVNRRDRLMLVTGARKQESKRRMGHAAEVSLRKSLVWTAPVLYWSNDDKHDYMDANGLEQSPVHRLIHKSGECLCGAFAQPGELAELRLWFPHVAAEIDRLSEIAKAAGKHAKWGERPPGAAKKIDQRFMPLCFSCVNH